MNSANFVEQIYQKLWNERALSTGEPCTCECVTQCVFFINFQYFVYFFGCFHVKFKGREPGHVSVLYTLTCMSLPGQSFPFTFGSGLFISYFHISHDLEHSLYGPQGLHPPSPSKTIKITFSLKFENSLKFPEIETSNFSCRNIKNIFFVI